MPGPGGQIADAFPRYRKAGIASSLLIVLSFVAAISPADARLYDVDDYLRTQTVHDVELSSANDLVAITVSRPAAVGDNYRVPYFEEDSIPLRDDLLVIAVRDAQIVLRVAGSDDGSSTFSPRWSPDGSKLAFLRIDRRGEVSLSVWDARTSEQSVLVPRLVRPVFPPVLAYGDHSRLASYAWISPAEIVLTLAGIDAPSQTEATVDAASRASRGQYSGRVWNASNTPLCHAEDRVVTVATDHSVITQVARGSVMAVSPSPSGDAMIVVTSTSHMTLPRDGPIRVPSGYMGGGPGDFAPYVRWSASMIVRRSEAWSSESGPITGQGPLFAETMPHWMGDGRQWAVITVDEPLALSSRARLHMRSVANDNAVSATEYLDRSEAIRELSRLTPTQLAITAEDATPSSLRNAGTLSVLGYTASGRRVIRSDRANVATFWSADGDTARPLMTINSHLASVRSPRPIPIQYESPNGDRTGWLFLPARHRSNPPVLVFAYPSSQPRSFALITPDGGDYAVLMNEALARGVAVFIADLRIPSSEDPAEQPRDRILSEIDAAITALHQNGRVDGTRLAFFGHSFGGYTALTLLAHRQYFRGIVAAAPLGDLSSYAFERVPLIDDQCGAAQTLVKQMSHEDPGSDAIPTDNNNLMRMGGPPYAHVDAYVRNSPVLQLGNAATPTLVIQGEMDVFADGHRLFNTLYRRGVDAELLYYRGEGHVIQGPENVRDMVRRTSAWLVEHLR